MNNKLQQQRSSIATKSELEREGKTAGQSKCGCWEQVRLLGRRGQRQ